ncbi:hypothetical protein MASR1M45_14790 [Candidatus Kapaibacterium sp.]
MQIFDRISRIIKSNFDSNRFDAQSYLDEEEDELKRIIDELNNPKKSSSDNKARSNNSGSNNKEYSNVSSDIADAFYTLGLKPDADIETIKAVYKKKMKEFHPDKVAHLSEEIKLRAESRAKDINQAYNKIKKFKGF